MHWLMGGKRAKPFGHLLGDLIKDIPENVDRWSGSNWNRLRRNMKFDKNTRGREIDDAPPTRRSWSILLLNFTLLLWHLLVRDSTTIIWNFWVTIIVALNCCMKLMALNVWWFPWVAVDTEASRLAKATAEEEAVLREGQGWQTGLGFPLRKLQSIAW